MQKLVLVLVGILAPFGLIGRALADDESDRRDLIRDIDDKVDRMAGELSGFDSDRDAGDLDDALSYARELKDLVSKLERVKGSDSRANDIASRYPGHIDSFRDAARHLKKLKEQQFLADGVADHCRNDEGNLQTLVRNYVGKPDDADEAFTVLPEKARQYGKTWSDKLDQLRGTDREVGNTASAARISISADRWSSVTSYFNDSASRIGAYWRDRFQAADTSCKRLALGEKHPDVERALEDLKKYTGNTKGTVTQLKKDYNEWLREARRLREFTLRDRDELREVMCRGGEYEMEKCIAEVADRWARQISSAHGTMLGQADRLRARAIDDKLKKYKGPKQVLEGLAANVANFEKLKNGELLGSNNPKIRAKIEYGKQKHRDLQSSMCSSGYPELEISSSYCSNSIRPGSGCRADCVQTSSTCMVIEIKPNSDAAKSEGDQQRAAYARGLENWYRSNKDELFNKYPKLRECERDGKEIRIDSRLEVYDYCPSDSRSLGDEVREVTTDISESE